MPFRRILFPIDFSKAAVAMVPAVSAMARRFDATVTVLNAFYEVPKYVLMPGFDEGNESPGVPIPYTPALEKLRGERQKHLLEFSRTHFSNVNHGTRLEDGDPAMVVDWVAKHEGTELIMMPTRGLGPFRRLLLGSIVAKVLHDVDCPVLTSAHEPDLALSSAAGYRSIVCAVGLGPETGVVLGEARLLAQAFGAKICFLQIGSLGDEHGQEIPAGSAQGDNTTVRILDGSVPDGIRQIAVDEKADLVIVGRGHAKGALSRAWSHLYTIIRESPCPVLSV
jgi:nucleotide-binding universal stress UspA family protein